MAYAVFDIETKRIAQDAKGAPHTYSTREQAEKIAVGLNYQWAISDECQDGSDRYTVKPI